MSQLDPLAAFRLDGKVVILTGASSGIGARFAAVLDAAGATVVMASRRLDLLEKVAADLDRGEPVACDLTQADDRRRLVEGTLERHGHIDVLVNNAGVTKVGPALEESDAEFEEVLAVDLVAPFALSRAVAAAMIEGGGGGAIVNVASVLGVVGVGQVPQAGYSAAKGGLVNLTRELAAQWARRGVRVNALAPGWFATEMTAEMFQDERSMAWVAKRAPMGRGGERHELDGALLFLASDASTYVTGQILAVDGGWLAV